MLLNVISSQIPLLHKYNNFHHDAISPSISDMICCFIVLSCMPPLNQSDALFMSIFNSGTGKSLLERQVGLYK
jgi:hypothetical protein